MTIHWPPERFYWSILDAPGWKRTGVLPAGLRPQFEDDTPLQGPDLHAVVVPVGDGRILVCAANKADLQGIDIDADSLIPDALPEFVGAHLDPARLNLLVGEFEPRAKRRARGIRQLTGGLAAMLCLVLVSIGFARRAEHQREIARTAKEATSALVAQVAPGTRPEMLSFEVARVRQSAEQGSKLRRSVDASLGLADLLSGWPSDVSCKPQSLSVTESSISLSVLVEGDAVPFLKAIRPPERWIMDQPRLNNIDKLTRLTLQFRPRQGGQR